MKLVVDNTITLDISGSRQTVRLCAARTGRPPLLIVQAGPGLPVINDVGQFQRLLNFERDFLIAYWDQRGCGDASNADARGVSLTQQLEDLRTVVQWLHGETQQRVLLFGISLGGTIALQAAARDPHLVKAVVGISPDSHTARGDVAADLFLRAWAAESGRRLRRAVRTLEPPPYLTLAPFQRRARLLADLGAIEHNRRFTELLRELLVSVFRTYGVVGGVKALRNLNTIQGRLLAEVAALDLLSHPPRVTVPVHYVFGEQDALNSESMVTDLPAAIAAPDSTVVRLRDAGHMAHFDQPEIVRSIVERI